MLESPNSGLNSQVIHYALYSRDRQLLRYLDTILIIYDSDQSLDPGILTPYLHIPHPNEIF